MGVIKSFIYAAVIAYAFFAFIDFLNQSAPSHPTEFLGLSIGDPLSDWAFQLGGINSPCERRYPGNTQRQRDLYQTCIEENETGGASFSINRNDSDPLNDVIVIVQYTPSRQVYSMWLSNPVYSLDLNISSDILTSWYGEPMILSTNRDFSERKYTYLVSEGFSFNGNNNYGATYTFINNYLVEYRFGPIEFEETRTIGEYYFNGRRICPGSLCPFSDDGSVSSTYRDIFSYARSRSIL